MRSAYLFQVFSETHNFFVSEGIQINLLTHVGAQIVGTLDEFAQFGDFLLLFQHGVDFLANTFRSHTGEFRDLTDVHTRRYAQRVQYDVNRRAVFIVRHIFDRVDLRDNTLVTVTACHFVTGLNLTFNGQIHFDNLQHARCQIVALSDFAAFRFEFFSNSCFSSSYCSASCSS